MKRTKGWCSPLPSRCRAAHYVSDDRTVALCGAPIRTHVATKRHPTEVCDHCNYVVWARRRK